MLASKTEEIAISPRDLNCVERMCGKMKFLNGLDRTNILEQKESQMEVGQKFHQIQT